MPIVKICGLSTPETLSAAIAAGADMVGFVFFERSPRNVSLDHAAELAGGVGGSVQKVALTVDADDEALDAVCRALRPDLLQLHGQETPARVAAVRRRYGLPVMKAVGIATAGDLEAVRGYRDVADWLLLDAKPPRDASRPGGNGLAFEWHLVAGVDRAIATMLSGGLDASNVGDAVRIARPFGVDVSSGVERSPGEKDPERIRAFIRAARAAFGATLAEDLER
jgi:phosphoribosylanthranilate isomerase